METTLTCREAVEFLADYLSGQLPESVAARFEAHLSVCPSCVAYALTYQLTVRLGRAALLCDDEPAPEGLVRAILDTREAGA